MVLTAGLEPATLIRRRHRLKMVAFQFASLAERVVRADVLKHSKGIRPTTGCGFADVRALLTYWECHRYVIFKKIAD